MPYFNVHVDTCEILDELSDKDLQQELKKRQTRKGLVLTPISEKDKSIRLRDAALELRKIDKIASAVWLEDIAAEMEIGQ